MTHFASFEGVVYSASSDGVIKKSTKESSDHQVFSVNATVKLTGAPVSLSIQNPHFLYVLQNNNHLAAIDVATFTVA